MTHAARPAGVIVVRAWFEHDDRLLARITYTLDVASADDPVVSSAVSPQGVRNAVDDWLAAFAARHANGDATRDAARDDAVTEE